MKCAVAPRPSLVLSPACAADECRRQDITDDRREINLYRGATGDCRRVWIVHLGARDFDTRGITVESTEPCKQDLGVCAVSRDDQAGVYDACSSY